LTVEFVGGAAPQEDAEEVLGVEPLFFSAHVKQRTSSSSGQQL
jgi:hypothetical protein